MASATSRPVCAVQAGLNALEHEPASRGRLRNPLVWACVLGVVACSAAIIIRQPHRQKQIVVCSPQAKDAIVTQQYAGRIHARRYINIRALDNGILQEVRVKEGQAVQKGDVLLKIGAKIYQAPFDGILGRLLMQTGNQVKAGDGLTTLSDNGMMWVYFDLPEKHYLDYLAGLGQDKEQSKIDLVLANGKKYPKPGKISAIDAKIAGGTIPCRADFQNPDGLLSHGQTGNIVLHRTLKNAIVIPQRAVFEIKEKRYVWVIGKDNVARQRAIVIQSELDDICVIKKGLDVNDKIVVDGVRQVRDGEIVQYELRRPEEAMGNQKK